MENEKKIVGEEQAPEQTEALSVDGAISDITELQADGALEQVEFIPLDSLLYESEDTDFGNTKVDDEGFESFFAEYRLLIAENLDAARKMNEEAAKIDTETSAAVEIEAQVVDQPTAPVVEKKKRAKKIEKSEAEENEEWSGEITLAPEEYESLDEEAEIFTELPEEQEDVVDLIGEEENTAELDSEEADESFQLSFFAEESKPEGREPEEAEENGYDPEKPRKIDTVFEFLELFIFTLVAVIILTSFVFKHSVVEGESMKTTLSDGEHLIVWDAFYTPERYDIVVFEDYSTALKKPVVKRIIGLPGDTVEIKNSSDGTLLVYVNGELIDEEYAYYGLRYSNPNTGVWTIGEGELFVLGDNRYNSTDSRDDRVGPINIDSLLGKVVLRFYPFKDFTFFN